MQRTIILLFCLFAFLEVVAQKKSVKFGKVDDALVKMTQHPLDTAADAIVLMDNGNLEFRYVPSKGFIYDLKIIKIIKVLKKGGLEYADFSVSTYHTNGENETVTGIKGYTYNAGKNNIEKSKLEKSSIFTEKSSENWQETKITFPDVEVGSVIELSYSLTSPFIWNLNTWAFQSDIPVVHSELQASIPEFFDYQFLQAGYIPLTINEKSTVGSSITLQNKSRSSDSYGTQRTGYSTNNINFTLYNYRWGADNVPAYKPEPYVASPTDYIAKMQFELKGTNYPNTPYEPYMGTWETLNKSFLESDNFSMALNQTGYMKNELDIISATEGDEAKIAMLIKIINNQVDWNGRYTRYIDNTLRSAWNDKSGATADINLMLVAGLRELGYTADPVLISTRGHGMIRDFYAVSSQFNSVIAVAEIGGKNYLLDATDRYIPAGALPKKCLNGKGWRVSKTSQGWVSLNPSANLEKMFQGTFIIDESGMVAGDVNTAAKGYAAYAAYESYKRKGEEDYIKSVQNNNTTWEIDDYEINDEAGLVGPFKCHYELELNENLIVAGDRIYFNPTMGEMMKESPFKLENREYPVDFAQPMAETYIFNFTLPEGYAVEEIPESVAFALPNNGGVFKYNITSKDNTVQVYTLYKINKPMFVQSEYAVLKQFYDQMVQKCAEQVVIKRKT